MMIFPDEDCPELEDITDEACLFLSLPPDVDPVQRIYSAEAGVIANILDLQRADSELTRNRLSRNRRTPERCLVLYISFFGTPRLALSTMDFSYNKDACPSP
uniref:Uncharacterized protein n=1 Tax=Ditylenchus dipsaci TaxID=166011 RepID=A0A915DFI8_9BILA